MTPPKKIEQDLNNPYLENDELREMAAIENVESPEKEEPETEEEQAVEQVAAEIEDDIDSQSDSSIVLSENLDRWRSDAVAQTHMDLYAEVLSR